MVGDAYQGFRYVATNGDDVGDPGLAAVGQFLYAIDSGLERCDGIHWRHS
jgi:hypothetical protein